MNVLQISIITAYRSCQADDIHCGLPSSSSSKNSNSADPCVPKEKKCDGYLDCRTGRDEDGCSGAKCRLDQFRCANGLKCIENARKCDHKADCDDGSDEQGCSKYLSTYCNSYFGLLSLRKLFHFTQSNAIPLNSEEILHFSK